MAKCIPTTKSNAEILALLGASSIYQTSIQATPFHEKFTHALYGLRYDKDIIDTWKERIKKIGGKHISCVKSNAGYAVFYFALPITSQELTKKKMEDDQKAKLAAAVESKFQEIKSIVECLRLDATYEPGQRSLARYLANGDLDQLLPLESYILLDSPANKDEKRIYDIVAKANMNFPHCLGMVSVRQCDMIKLAHRMNDSITDEDKRLRRKAACLKYGLKFLAKCFDGQ